MYTDGKMLFIAGTKTSRDVFDDLLIPLHMTFLSDRYHQAEQVLVRNRGIKYIVGHSLGGSVSLDLAAKYNKIPITYGAPVMDMGLSSKGLRYKHLLDPVAMFDIGAQMSDTKFEYPHAFHNFEPTHKQREFYLEHPGADRIEWWEKRKPKKPT